MEGFDILWTLLTPGLGEHAIAVLANLVVWLQRLSSSMISNQPVFKCR